MLLAVYSSTHKNFRVRNERIQKRIPLQNFSRKVSLVGENFNRSKRIKIKKKEKTTVEKLNVIGEETLSRDCRKFRLVLTPGRSWSFQPVLRQWSPNPSKTLLSLTGHLNRNVRALVARRNETGGWCCVMRIPCRIPATREPEKPFFIRLNKLGAITSTRHRLMELDSR